MRWRPERLVFECYYGVGIKRILGFGWILTLAAVGCADRKTAPFPVRSLVFSADEKRLAAGGGNISDHRGRPYGGYGEIRTWDTQAWKLGLSSREGFTDPVNSVYFSSEGAVVTVSKKYRRDTKGGPFLGVELRSWPTDKECSGPEVLLDFCLTPAAGVGISPDQKTVTFAGNGPTKIYKLGESRILNIYQSKFLVQLERTPIFSKAKEDEGEISLQLVFSPDGKTILARTQKSPSLRLYDVASGGLMATLDPGNATAQLVAFAPDGRQIAAICNNDKVYLLSADLKQTVRSFEAQGVVPALAFAPDGKTLAVKLGRATVRLYDVATGEVLKTFAGYDEGVNCMAFSTSRYLAFGCGGHPGKSGPTDGRIYVIDRKSGKLVADLK